MRSWLHGLISVVAIAGGLHVGWLLLLDDVPPTVLTIAVVLLTVVIIAVLGILEDDREEDRDTQELLNNWLRRQRAELQAYGSAPEPAGLTSAPEPTGLTSEPEPAGLTSELADAPDPPPERTRPWWAFWRA